jgi:ferrous iron transport protein A
MADYEPVAQFPLAAMAPGQRGRVHSLAWDSATEKMAGRLLELGFDEGVVVEVLHTGPFGGNPLAVLVGNATVALRRAEASLVRLVAQA